MLAALMALVVDACKNRSADTVFTVEVLQGKNSIAAFIAKLHNAVSVNAPDFVLPVVLLFKGNIVRLLNLIYIEQVSDTVGTFLRLEGGVISPPA